MCRVLLAAALLVGVRAQSCAPSAIDFQSWCYSTLDLCPPTTTKADAVSTGACTTCPDYAALPNGWEVAPYSADIAGNVIAAGRWGTDVIVTSSGQTHATLDSMYAPGSQWGANGTNYLLARPSDGKFRSQVCHGKVLMRSWNSVPTAAPTVAATPTVVINAPDTIGTCDDVMLDASASFGDNGAAWASVAWSVGSVVARAGAPSFAATQATANITAAIAAAPAGGLTLSLPRSLFVETSSQTFTLTLTNVAGRSDSKSMVVLKVHDPIPAVSIAGPSSVTVTRTARLEIVGSGALPTCADGASAVSPSSPVTFSWMLVQATTVAAADAFRAALASFTARNPSTLEIPAAFLVIGETYVVQLNGSLPASGSGGAHARIAISVAAQRPIAIVAGGNRDLVANATVVLDARQSYNPDFASAGESTMTFAWMCVGSSNQSFAPCVFSAAVPSDRRSASRVALSAAEANAAFALPSDVGGGSVTFTLTLTVTSVASGFTDSASVDLTLRAPGAAGIPALPLVELAMPLQPAARVPMSAVSIASKVSVFAAQSSTSAPPKRICTVPN